MNTHKKPDTGRWYKKESQVEEMRKRKSQYGWSIEGKGIKHGMRLNRQVKWKWLET